MNFQDAPAQERHIPSGAPQGLPFERVADDLRRSAEAVCAHLLRGGRKNGREFEASNLRGGWSARSKSLSVNLDTGVWKDFSSGETGADLINLWAAVHGLSQIDAKREAESWLGYGESETKPTPPRKETRLAPVPAAAAPQPPSTPAQAPTIAPADGWWMGKKAARIWTYTDSRGEVFGQVYRFEHPDIKGVKAIRPWDGMAWKMPEGQRPLLNLQDIMATDQPIVWVEGEKAADAVKAVGWCATTCMGGAAAVAKTDFSPLRGRDVIAWPDNDKAGFEALDRLKEALKDIGVASLKVVTIPAGMPAKWDAADADEVERRRVIGAAYESRPVVTGRPQLRLTDWKASNNLFKRAPKERQWLVRETFPLGAVTLLAAMGDMGKGMMILDLALKVACGAPAPMGPVSFGCTVASFGQAIILSAEDDFDEMHRRLRAIDERKLHQANGDRLHLIPLPNVGGAFPMFQSTSKGHIESTTEFEMLRDQLLAMEDVRLIVIDPLSSFVQADLIHDAANAAFVCGQLAMLAAETGACVMMVHHVRKDSANGGTITSPEQARAAVRGSSALVDGVRSAYVLWHAQEVDSRKSCKVVGREYKRGLVVHGAVVKSNGPADRTTRTFIRNEQNGLLIDHTSAVRQVLRFERSDIQDALIDAIARAAVDGQPFTKTGLGGIYENKHRLSEVCQNIGRNRLQGEINNLLASGRIVLALASGSAAKQLDVPDGPYARGHGQLSAGAQPIYGEQEGVGDEETDESAA